MSRHYDIRDGVLNALLDTYYGEHPRGWHNVKYKDNYTVDVCMQLTTDILALYVWADIGDGHVAKHYREPEVMLNEIQQLIWMVFPGGSTAEIAAKRVGTVLGLEQ